MSTKDISRFLLQPRKHYIGMRMQQGRVLLDSDYNEGARHDDEDQRRTLLDFIGPQGSPDQGFSLGATDDEPLSPGDVLATIAFALNGSAGVTVALDYFVLPGSMYVGGLRLELEDPEQYVFQSDFLQIGITDIPDEPASSAEFGHFFYLEAWEQCVTAVEDGEILEHALGGPDTSVRVRRMRRVRFAPALEGENCAAAFARVMSETGEPFAQLDPKTGELVSFGRLKLEFAPGESEDTCAPCHPDPTGRYLGAENQALRVMLTDSNHFVWAYDNASPIYRVSVVGIGEDPSPGDVVVEMLTLPKDEEHWPLSGRVVEIIPWSAILDNGEKVADEVGVFCVIDDGYDPETHKFTLDTEIAMDQLNQLVHAWDTGHPRASELNVAEGGERLFYVRFWHQTNETTPAEIETTSGAALGSSGIVPNFANPGRRGDFWIGALRPETPNRIVPHDLQDEPNGVPPHGPHHYFAPLMVVRGTGTTVSSVEDCRRPIVPATDTGCCTFSVGDGVHSFGQFTSIQAAVSALPPDGGKVCVRPGVYVEEILIDEFDNVTIEGCGDQSVLESPTSPEQVAIVRIQESDNVTIRSLSFRPSGQGAVSAEDSAGLTLVELNVVEDPASSAALNRPLVDLVNADEARLRSLRIDTVRQSAIRAENLSQSKLDNLLLTTSSDDIGTIQAPPLVDIPGIGNTVFSNSRLIPNGRIGLLLDSGGSDHTLIDRLDFQCNSRGPIAAKSAIVTREQFLLQIANCRIHMNSLGVMSESAAVDLMGDEITFRNNSVSHGDANVWGGVHVRGGDGIRVINNWITNGRGHGVTLGGVFWNPVSGPTVNRREPAGRGQLNSTGPTGDLTTTFMENGTEFRVTAVDAVEVANIVIADNQIERFSTNGISVLTVMGLPAGVPFISCKGLVIERNRISDCFTGAAGRLVTDMRTVDDVVPIGGSFGGVQSNHGTALHVLPFGGIVLAALTDYATIRDNLIVENGGIVERPVTEGPPEFLLPAFNGVFALVGESITISGNRIADNGPLWDGDAELLPGLRAGIAVVWATTGVADGLLGMSTLFPNPLPERAETRSPWDFALRVTGNSVIQPEGRALYALGTGAMTFDANYLASRGLNATESPPEVDALGDVVYVHNVGLPWEVLDFHIHSLERPSPVGGVGLPTDAHRYLIQRGLSAAKPVLFAGFGGHVLFNNNQVVLDWMVETFLDDTVLSYFPVAVISTDHVGMHGNQFALRLDNRQTTSPELPFTPATDGSQEQLLLSHVFVLGATVDVTGNRAAEGAQLFEAALVSMFTIGLLMNNTSLNQTTRCIVRYQGVDDNDNSTAFTNYVGNLVMLNPDTTNADPCLALRLELENLAVDLRDLLWDRSDS